MVLVAQYLEMGGDARLLVPSPLNSRYYNPGVKVQVKDAPRAILVNSIGMDHVLGQPLRSHLE